MPLGMPVREPELTEEAVERARAGAIWPPSFPSRLAVLSASRRTRTEITAGFTLATMSANPGDCIVVSAASAEPVQGRRVHASQSAGAREQGREADARRRTPSA